MVRAADVMDYPATPNRGFIAGTFPDGPAYCVAFKLNKPVFQSAFRARIDGYFALPPNQRQAEIDRQINQDEMMRKAFEAGRSVMTALGGGQGSPAGGQTTAAPASGRSAAAWSNRSEDERNRWRKSMIDRTSPQDRARYTEYRRAVDARRDERGLPNQWPR